MDRISTALSCNAFYWSISSMLLWCSVKFLILEKTWIMGFCRQYCPIMGITGLAWMEHWGSSFEIQCRELESRWSLLFLQGGSEKLRSLSFCLSQYVSPGGAGRAEGSHAPPGTAGGTSTLPYLKVLKGSWEWPPKGVVGFRVFFCLHDFMHLPSERLMRCLWILAS